MKKTFLYSGEFSGNSLLKKFQVIFHFKILKKGLPRYPLKVLKLFKQLYGLVNFKLFSRVSVG